MPTTCRKMTEDSIILFFVLAVFFPLKNLAAFQIQSLDGYELGADWVCESLAWVVRPWLVPRASRGPTVFL